MSDTAKLATDVHALAVKFGAILIQSEKLCNEGAAWDGEELTRLAGEIREVNGLLNGIYFTAKSLLDEDDFNRFVYRCGIQRGLIEDGIAQAQAAIIPIPS